MRFAILGAGALGTILAAHLVRAGHDVSVIARGERLKTLRRDGLIVHGLLELKERCTVIDDPASLHSTDVLAIATKALDTQASLAKLAHVKSQMVFSMQNGVLKDELLAAVFPAASVIGAMADFSGELFTSGETVFTRNVGLHLGELKGGQSERVTNLAKLIDDAGVRCIAATDIQTREWSKFVAWAGLIPLAALTRLTTWKFLLDEDAVSVAVRLVREVARLAAAMNVKLIDLSPLPAETIARVSEREGIEAVLEVGRKMRENAPEHRMSVLQDIERGSRLEMEETLGFAVRRGRELGVAMPTLESCYGLIATVAHQR